jgi:replication factor C subunit 3/5
MKFCLEHVAKSERFTLPPDVSERIVIDARGNLRKAILVLEALKMQRSVIACYICSAEAGIHLSPSPTLTGPLSIAKPDWETYCHKLGDMIVQEQSPARVMEIRGKFYELLVHCIPPSVILKVRMGSIKADDI